jgi:SAM-dependent methyltransferase
MQLPFELDSLAEARNYQRWVFDAVRPYLGRRILEVGSGIGNMSQWLPADELLVLTETHPQFVEILRARVPSYFGPRAANVPIHELELGAGDPRESAIDQYALDTIVSFNVLEHIEDDRGAVAHLLGILRASRATDRRLVSFVPAQAWALSDLDRHYGHFRRYSRRRLLDLSRDLAPDARLTVTPFNALGFAGWVWRAMILRESRIDERSVKAYNAICRHTRDADDFLCRRLRYPLGQSFVWVLELPRRC